MFMKTKQRQKEGARCLVRRGAHPQSKLPRSGERHFDSWLLTPDYRNLQVHPAMLMKTKQRQKEGARCQSGEVRIYVQVAQKRQTAFRLLASDS